MHPYLPILRKMPLFNGIETTHLLSVLQCLKAVQKQYRKGEVILAMGEEISTAGIVLKGRIQVIVNDDAGNQMMMNQLKAGDLFAETFACVGHFKSPIHVTAASACVILQLHALQLFSPHSCMCPFRLHVIENLLKLVAEQHIFLSRKIQLLTKRTIRGKLRVYLLGLAKEAGSMTFTVPFTRYELADYLFTNRSALSRELCKMRDEGLIAFDRNQFTLLQKDF